MTETVFRLKRHLTSFQIMILGFAGVILLGALVLMLPIATVQRVWTPFHEALFTSTSAVCVTGLVVQDIDVMLELSGCDPSFLSSERLESPFLLRFTGSGEELSYLFTVAWMDTSERILATSRMKGERIIWISDRRDSRGIALPRHHIFAVRQEDGTHRFFGSHEPEKI